MVLLTIAGSNHMVTNRRREAEFYVPQLAAGRLYDIKNELPNKLL